jgi:hypothetical protein
MPKKNQINNSLSNNWPAAVFKNDLMASVRYGRLTKEIGLLVNISIKTDMVLKVLTLFSSGI